MKEFFLEWLSNKFGEGFVITGTIAIVILAAKVVKWLESSDEESSASNKSQEDGSENDE